MEIYNDILCVGIKDLEGVLSKDNLQALVKRGRIERVRRGCYNTPALYSLDSLPQRFRERIVADVSQLTMENGLARFLSILEMDRQALMYYDNYMLDGGWHLPVEKRLRYTNSACILNACRRLMASYRGNLGEFWTRAAAIISKMEFWPNSLPNNPRGLQQKYNAYIKEGYSSLISSRFCKNSSKAGKDSRR